MKSKLLNFLARYAPTKEQFNEALGKAFRFLADELSSAIKNPKTTTAGIAVWATIPALKTLPEKIGAFFAGLGFIHSHDGNTGASKTTERSDKVVEQVEALKLPNPTP